MSTALDLTAGLIGENIGRSRLPKALKRMCDMHGISLRFSLIDTAHLKSFDFEETVDGLREKDWTGVTVTHPFKTQAADYANEGMAPSVAGLGASNLLVFGRQEDPDDVAGHNTDYTGFLSAWRARMGNISPGRIAVAGAGGVAHAIVPALERLGATEIVIWDPQIDRAIALAGKVSVAKAIPMMGAPEAVRQANGLVNASPLGMREYPGSAFDPSTLGEQDWAFDAVYTPTDTEFLKSAERAGLRCMSGFDLFQHMAIRSFEVYTGLRLNVVDMVAELDPLRPE